MAVTPVVVGEGTEVFNPMKEIVLLKDQVDDLKARLSEVERTIGIRRENEEEDPDDQMSETSTS